MIIESKFSLEGKIVLITGASSGIGRQCAISCSQQGAILALFGRDLGKLQDTLALTENPSNHIIYGLDLTEFDRVDAFVNKVVQEKGRIDGVINCAGISTTLPINAISTKKMEQFLRTNVMGSLNLTKHAVRMTNFSLNGGSIIFVCSVMGVVGEKGKSLYSLTKGALISAVKSLSVELASRKIRVNAVSPGVVETPMSANAIYSRDEVSRNKIIEMHPLGLGQPEDVANACIFLLSDAARWITGSNLIVDGGYLAK